MIPVDGDGGDFRLRGHYFKQTIIAPLVQLRRRHVGKVAAEKQVVGRDGIHVGNHALEFRAVKQRVHVNVAEEDGRKFARFRGSFWLCDGIRCLADPSTVIWLRRFASLGCREVVRRQLHFRCYEFVLAVVRNAVKDQAHGKRDGCRKQYAAHAHKQTRVHRGAFHDSLYQPENAPRDIDE